MTEEEKEAVKYTENCLMKITMGIDCEFDVNILDALINIIKKLQKENEELNNLLTSALSEYKKRGQDYAKAYKNYRILVAQELLRLRDSGVPVTICHDLGLQEPINGVEQIPEPKKK